jgi:hypothetical protein
MIICPICHTANQHLAVSCTLCGCFIQPRVENLDLFSTLGHLIESPLKTFHTIAVARHKNFIVILSAIFGWPLVFTLFWLMHAGEYASSFLNLLLAGMATGPAAGVILVTLVAFLLSTVSKLTRRKISFKNSFALAAYSFTPFIYIFIFVFPVIFLTFGIYFFTLNPSPSFLRPFSYHVLTILHYCVSAWALILFLMGIKVMSDGRWSSALVVWGTTCGVTAGLFYGLFHFLVV